ncbi:hypothetical protein LWP59_22755 [Amycolatopsis acidiphila]|uniref:hypothetical protein n=1 Tax=Amycolatopsis acidiphila TaxID=715473 RepID=UPI0016437ECD|nr:hypothetical protein [Amycolatopsis acidiphila]UIJ56979.1 hypothetical protein LWP59_22755 [Amycolatopsis acidiphila]GHG53996.1 hypothetical protein GCM10017788_03280 [Amycolatopsis acidiphila]
MVSRFSLLVAKLSFVFVSGNLALDLAGTLKWRRDEPEELLTAPADAARGRSRRTS